MIKAMNVSMRPYSEREVLDFISKFGPHREALKGEMCYWFARILKERFRGEIVYLTNEHRFCAKIENRFYDADGNITGAINPYYAIPWKEYEYREPSRSARIKRSAIWKISDEAISNDT